jgi:hypothetical protein
MVYLRKTLASGCQPTTKLSSWLTQGGQPKHEETLIAGPATTADYSALSARKQAKSGRGSAAGFAEYPCKTCKPCVVALGLR